MSLPVAPSVRPLSGKVRLRPVASADLPLLHRWQVHEADPWTESCRPPQALADEAEHAARLRERMAAGLAIWLVLCGDEPVGKVQCFDHNPRNRSAELGVFMARAWRGQGLMRQALECWLPGYFADHHKLIATVHEGNQACLRLLGSLGFQIDGRQREHFWIGDRREDQLILSLLAREHRARAGAVGEAGAG